MSRPEEIVDRAARGLSHRLASRATRRSFLAGIAAGAFALVGARPAESRIAGVRGTNARGAGRLRRPPVPGRAPARSCCRGSTRAASRCAPPTVARFDNLGG